MELFDKKIIIEFNGLPGSGKTTTARLLLSKLREEGFVANTSYYSSESKKRAKHLFFEHRYLFLFVKLFLYSIYSLHKLDLKNAYGMTVIVRNYVDFRENGSGVLVSDQGLVQKLLSFVYLKQTKDNSYLRPFISILKKYDFPIVLINVNCDVIETITRLQNRHANESRLNRLKGTELVTGMKSQALQLDAIRSVIRREFPWKQYEMDSQNQIEDNVNVFFCRFMSDLNDNKSNV